MGDNGMDDVDDLAYEGAQEPAVHDRRTEYKGNGFDVAGQLIGDLITKGVNATCGHLSLDDEARLYANHPLLLFDDAAMWEGKYKERQPPFSGFTVVAKRTQYQLPREDLNRINEFLVTFMRSLTIVKEVNQKGRHIFAAAGECKNTMRFVEIASGRVILSSCSSEPSAGVTTWAFQEAVQQAAKCIMACRRWAYQLWEHRGLRRYRVEHRYSDMPCNSEHITYVMENFAKQVAPVLMRRRVLLKVLRVTRVLHHNGAYPDPPTDPLPATITGVRVTRAPESHIMVHIKLKVSGYIEEEVEFPVPLYCGLDESTIPLAHEDGAYAVLATLDFRSVLDIWNDYTKTTRVSTLLKNRKDSDKSLFDVPLGERRVTGIIDDFMSKDRGACCDL